jgi:hypothetical protein
VVGQHRHEPACGNVIVNQIFAQDGNAEIGQCRIANNKAIVRPRRPRHAHGLDSRAAFAAKVPAILGHATRIKAVMAGKIFWPAWDAVSIKVGWRGHEHTRQPSDRASDQGGVAHGQGAHSDVEAAFDQV